MPCMDISQGVGRPVPANASLKPNTSAIAAVKRVIADRSPEVSIRIGIPKLLPDVMAAGRESIKTGLGRAKGGARPAPSPLICVYDHRMRGSATVQASEFVRHNRRRMAENIWDRGCSLDIPARSMIPTGPKTVSDAVGFTPFRTIQNGDAGEHVALDSLGSGSPFRADAVV